MRLYGAFWPDWLDRLEDGSQVAEADHRDD